MTLVAVLSSTAAFSALALPVSVTTANQPLIPPVARNGAVDTPLLTAVTNPDILSGRGGADIQVIDGALVSTGPVGADVIAREREINNMSGEIRVYTVREGDSLSKVAEMFGVTTNTILWANDLPRATAIRPGDRLVILPVAGVRHTIVRGDTLASIAQRYRSEADEILAYNQLASAADLVVGEELIIPGGSIQAAPARVAIASGAASGGTTASASSDSFLSHPAPGAIRTQGIHGFNAVDLAAAIGTPIRAAAAGEVVVSRSSGWNGGYGQYIVIRHSNGVQTLYSHLSRNDVGVGAWVQQGQVIGAMGNTGRSTGPHLHFEVRGARNPF